MISPDTRSRLWAEAAEVLASNDTGKFIKPGPRQYPGQWNWDAAFNAIGLAHVDAARARHEIRSLLDGQWSDGMVPHIVFHDSDVEYFPGPQVWGRVDLMPRIPTSCITQPPLLATAVARLHELSPEPDFVREVIGPIDRWHGWFGRRRSGDGLVRIHHPWESGMDNSPRFDRALSQVEPSPIEFERRDTIYVARDQRPTDADYDAYISILVRLRQHEYRPGRGLAPFEVEDPFLTGVLLQAENDLARLCEAADLDSNGPRRRADRLRRVLTSHLAAASPSGGIPSTVGDLLSTYGVPTSQAVDRLVAALRAPSTFGPSPTHPWCLTGVGKSDRNFDSRRYWRGPVWVNMNWLAIRTLRAAGHQDTAESLRRSTLQMIDTNGFWEYYDPQTGAGLGSSRFSWTAALALDLMSGS